MTHDQDSPSPADHDFSTLGLLPALQAVLTQRHFKTPTPIQAQSIKPAMEGKDLIGIAQTGTGKTLAFGLPMLQRLTEHGGRGLVVVPTRELAAQVGESLEHFGRAVNIKVAVFVGGASMGKQREALRQNPRILVATPGRLNDHLQQGTISLNEVKIVVLDEADHMFDMGFKPQIDRILAKVPKERQMMLFSATMPHEIAELATKNMKMPLRIEIARAGTTAENVEQELFIVRKEDKLQLLQKILSETNGPVLVFSRTKHGAKKMTKVLRDNKFTAAEIHANRSLSQRKEALDGFKSGRYRVLVATDIAARGIHVSGIELVISYDLPDDISNYVHRIGRTARAGRSGKAISFATPDQERDIRDIEKLIRGTLTRKGHSLPPMPSRPSERHEERGPRQHRQQRSRHPQQRQHGQQRNQRTFSRPPTLNRDSDDDQHSSGRKPGQRYGR